MNRFCIMIFSVVCIGIVATSAHADSLRTRQVTGRVTGIDTKAHTVTVEKKNSRVIVSVVGKSDIIQCTPKRSITDIMIGDKVTVKYYESEVENRAKSITITERAK